MYLEDIKVGQRVGYRGHSYTITKNVVKYRGIIRPYYSTYSHIRESTNPHRSRMYFQRERVEDKSESIDGLYDEIEGRMDRGLMKFLNMSKKNNYY